MTSSYDNSNFNNNNDYIKIIAKINEIEITPEIQKKILQLTNIPKKNIIKTIEKNSFVQNKK